MDELKQVFLQESSEQLDALESLLLELENQPDDATTLNGIFRAAHTIKGAAGKLQLLEKRDALARDAAVPDEEGRARQAGEVQAVMASLVMMIAGAVNVLAAPWVRTLFF